MRTIFMLVLACACFLLCQAGPSLAARHGGDADRGAMQNREMIYGSQLMTEQERLAYRERMRAVRTQEEREHIRQEHHERMQERAEAQGLRLPDTPPPKGGGAMRSGGGMGAGKGKNR